MKKKNKRKSKKFIIAKNEKLAKDSLSNKRICRCWKYTNTAMTPIYF